MRGCPLYRCTSRSHSYSVGTIRFGLSPFLCIPLLANRSYSSGPAEVATKTVTSWSKVLDAPNEDQCGLFDVGPPTYDQRGPLDAPNDNHDSSCAGVKYTVLRSTGVFSVFLTCATPTHAPFWQD